MTDQTLQIIIGQFPNLLVSFVWLYWMSKKYDEILKLLIGMVERQEAEEAQSQTAQVKNSKRGLPYRYFRSSRSYVQK